MKRAQRIIVEIIAIAGFWFLWDFRIAASLFLLVCLVEAMRQDKLDARGGVPILKDIAAPPVGREESHRP